MGAAALGRWGCLSEGKVEGRALSQRRFVRVGDGAGGERIDCYVMCGGLAMVFYLFNPIGEHALIKTEIPFPIRRRNAQE